MWACVNLCLGMSEWEVWRGYGTSVGPTHSTPGVVVVRWKQKRQKSYYFAHGDHIERARDSWTGEVHKDLAWMAVVAHPELASSEPTEPTPLGMLPGMEDTAEP